jgi:endonuclease V-like protein UPF0215 family
MANNEINRVPELLPEDIANTSTDFVLFLKKYYEFLNQEGMPSDNVARALHKRNLDQAVDNYLDVLYLEFGYGYVFNRDANKSNILSNLSQIYSAKGSLDSVKVLFRIIFGEEVSIRLPKDVILQPSHGNWLSQYSVMAVLQEGNPFEMDGKFVEVKTQFADTPVQTFDVEVKRVELRDSELGIYEIYTSRYFSGFFGDNSEITYRDTKLKLTRSMSGIVADGIEEAGSGFRIGDTYEIASYERGNAYNELIGLPSSLTRNTPSQSKFRSIDEENVDIDVRTDGTITEVSTKETDKGVVKTTTIIRGNRRTVKQEFPDGTVTENSETIKGFAAPNLQVDWDAIAEAMIELVDFEFDDFKFRAYNLLNEVNPNTTYKYGDANSDGVVDYTDFVYFLRLAYGSSRPTGSAQDFFDEWNSRYPQETISPSVSVARLLLKFNSEEGQSSIIRDILTDRITSLIGERYVGDIDNDGLIDTTDLFFIYEYSDLATRPFMNVDAKNYIEGEIFPLPAELDQYNLTEEEKLDYLLAAFADNYQKGARNPLHDFLLQEDVDYTGYPRADINNDGIVSQEDVKLLLRRASGVKVDSGSIQDVNYSQLVGGYASIDPQVVDPHGTEGVISGQIESEVLTNLNIFTPGIGLTSATVSIYDRTRTKRGVSGVIGESTAKVDIRDGRIRDVDMLSIGNRYNTNSTVVSVQYSQDKAKIFPTISNGQIVGFDILDPGTGYTNLTGITIDGNGEGFVGDVVVKDGVITGLELASGGSGYSNDVTVTVNSTTGTGANIEAIVEDGVIAGFNVIDGGELYNFSDNELINLSNNTVTITDNLNTPTEEANVTKVNTQDGLISGITIYEQGGSASPSSPVDRPWGDYTYATVQLDRVTQEPDLQPIIQDGVIFGFKVIDGGVGYTSENATIELNAERSETILTPIIESGVITDIQVANGYGYPTGANIIITDPNHTGTDANIELIIIDGSIERVVVIDGGSGYVNPALTVDSRLDAVVSVDIGTDHLTWIDEVIVEPLLGSEYNPILKAGSGKGGQIRIQEVGGNGEIRKIKFQSFGYNYPNYFTTFIQPNNQNGTVATLGFKSEIVGVTSPSYVDRKGFLSDIIKVQDNNLYQQFSYVIETGVSFDLFEDIVKKSVHPAGMKVFGEQTITDFFEVDTSIDEASAAFQNRLFLDVTDHSDGDDWHMVKDLPRQEDPSDSTAVTDDTDDTYVMHKPKFDVTDVQSNTDDVWYFEKDLTVDGYHEHQTATALKETYHMFKESESTNEVLSATHNKETWVMYKPLFDTAITSDDTTIADDDIYSMRKVISDSSYAVSNKETYSLFKPRFDSTTNADEDNWSFVKDRTDEALTSDDIIYNTLQKVKSDSVDLTDVEGKHINKSSRQDSVSVGESKLLVALGLNLYQIGSDPIVAYPENTTSVSDTDKYSFVKSLTDIARVEDDTALVGVDDDNIISINKTKNDTALTSDSGGFVHRVIYAYDYFESPEDYAHDDLNYTF